MAHWESATLSQIRQSPTIQHRIPDPAHKRQRPRPGPTPIQDLKAATIDEEMRGRAREKLEEVRRLVKQTEKRYEQHVPDWDEWEPSKYICAFKEGEIVGYHCRNDEIDRLQKEIDSLK